ncbi:hypothetical protein [Microvirga antarctica]|uniref:hypothetical protein n=1 Tax=Microvirga antarctica TaxID=2819233 RepID=UPI001B309252|nr:hypothetical protein [Microvirga antarctica]
MRSLVPMFLLSVFIAPLASPSQASLAERTLEGTAVTYMAGLDETHVSTQTGSVCVALALPKEWRGGTNDDGQLTLRASSGEGELEIVLRPVRDLTDWSDADAVKRDAAFLQRDHESLLGRPAQAVNLEAVGAAARWTATWIDASLPSPSHSMTVETYIVPASRDWLVELSVSEIDDRRLHEALVARILSGLQTTSRCARSD